MWLIGDFSASSHNMRSLSLSPLVASGTVFFFFLINSSTIFAKHCFHVGKMQTCYLLVFIKIQLLGDELIVICAPMIFELVEDISQMIFPFFFFWVKYRDNYIN